MLPRTAIKRPVTTVMIILMVFLAGIVSYNDLELAYMPSTDVPMAVVMTTYTGAGPEEVEELVTKPIEQQLVTITGVDTISSTSSTGSSTVMIEFVDGTDLDEVTNDIREKIDRVEGQLPDDASDPTIMKMDMNSTTLTVGVTSEGYDIDTLYSILDANVTSRFERLEGVSAVDISGGSEKEVRITVDPEKLDGYGITISTLKQTLSNENTTGSAGEIQQGDTDLELRAVGEFKDVEEIKDLVITTSGNNVIHMSDVADVKMVIKDKESLSLINGQEGISYSITKQSDANIVTVSDTINQAIAELEKDYPDMHFELMTTTSDYIKTSIENIIQTAFQSALIAVIILLFFLRDFRMSLVIGVSIPASIVATFAMMWLKGMTMNTISMSGIVIGIGMLVDNSVVVLENINTYWQNGYTPKEAAEKGTNEIAMSVMASTLTTVAVFGTLIFVSGTIGTILQDIAYTICFSLIASLIVSLTFVPMACSQILKDKAVHKKSIFSPIGKISLAILDFLDNIYTFVLKHALKHRFITIIIVLLCFGGSLMTIPFMSTDLMSSSDEGAFTISASTPDGSLYEYNKEILDEITEAVGVIPEQESTSVRIGGGGRGRSNSAISMEVNLVDKEERDRSTDEIVQEMKEKLKNIAGCEITVSASSNAMGSMGGGSKLSLNITGDETDTLREISDDLVDIISTIPGATDVESSLDKSIPQGELVLNRAKASKYGISTSDVANAVSTAITGTVATTYKIDGDEYDVRIKYDEDRIKYISDLQNIKISSQTGVQVPLTEIVDIEIGESATSITRENQKRYITLSASFDGVATSQVQKLVQEKLNDYIFPDGYSYEFGGNMKTMQEAFSSLAIALMVAVLLVYMIMASQFESVIYPFIIMFSMPLAITGGILGLFVTGNSITTTAYMGFIMLVGMVVNNAIVLVDYTNQIREKRELECNDALLTAGRSRLRPILMTTLTTVIGLMPMAIASGSGMESQQPLAIAVIFGLSISTLVTLIFIPILYSLVNSLLSLMKKISKKLQGMA